MTNPEAIGPSEDLAQALADQLTELGYPASRNYYPIIRLDDVETLHIFVRPDGDVATAHNRNSNRHEVTVSILIVKNIKAPQDVSEFDGFARTVEEIKAFWENPEATDELGDNAGVLRHKKLAGLAWSGKISNDQLFDQDRLYYHNQMTSVVGLAYSGTR